MEISLTGFELPKGYEVSSIIKQLNFGEYLEILESPFFWDVFQSVKHCDKNDLEKEPDFIKLCRASDKQLEVLAAGIAPLILFIQKNWTGPNVSLSETKLHNFEFTKNILKELIGDGESVVSTVELPELLYISKVILEAAYSAFKELQIIKIWYLRYLFIHQQILEELSPNLFEKINIVINEIRPALNSLLNSAACALHLEFARIFMYYHNVQKSKEDVQRATELSHIQMSLSGALGKRTKFQSEYLAQLILKVNVDDDGNSTEEPDEEIFQLPKDLKLDDEVRLDKIKFADSLSNTCPNLTGLQQAVILGNLFQAKKSQPNDSLVDEELQALIHCILERPKLWSVKKSALLLRSKLEGNHKRTVERTMMQLEILVDDINDPNISLSQKSKFFFASHLPPKWEIQFMFANVLASMGSIKSALEIYLSLEDWESVIGCYNALQMRHKAREIIELELNKNPTPKLWCLLGDATDDVSCYEKAWELSNKKSARSQRHWALFYYYRQNYAESIEHFQKSLEINSLQKEMWYRLGYASLVEEKWEISASAYRRYVVLDPECFEAWNNLARCYCELKQKERAWRVLQEALKINYSNWKVWDNYMVVSADLKMFDDVIKSYHEILNIKEKHLDKAVLNLLVIGLENFETDENDQKKLENKNKFRSKLLELFGRLTSQIINDADLWFFYSEVIDTDSTENLMKKHQLLMKAHRSAVNKTGWEKNLETCNRVVYVLSKLVEVGLLIKKPDILMSCKFASSGALVQINKEYPDAGVCENLEKKLAELEKALLE